MLGLIPFSTSKKESWSSALKSYIHFNVEFQLFLPYSNNLNDLEV